MSVDLGHDTPRGCCGVEKRKSANGVDEFSARLCVELQGLVASNQALMVHGTSNEWWLLALDEERIRHHVFVYPGGLLHHGKMVLTPLL